MERQAVKTRDKNDSKERKYEHAKKEKQKNKGRVERKEIKITSNLCINYDNLII